MDTGGSYQLFIDHSNFINKQLLTIRKSYDRVISDKKAQTNLKDFQAYGKPKIMEKLYKQAETELGQAQHKLRLDFTLIMI